MARLAVLACAVLALAALASAAPLQRTSRGLVALYEFDDGPSATEVAEDDGLTGLALSLAENGGSTAWLADTQGLRCDGATSIAPAAIANATAGIDSLFSAFEDPTYNVTIEAFVFANWTGMPVGTAMTVVQLCDAPNPASGSNQPSCLHLSVQLGTGDRFRVRVFLGAIWEDGVFSASMSLVSAYVSIDATQDHIYHIAAVLHTTDPSNSAIFANGDSSIAVFVDGTAVSSTVSSGGLPVNGWGGSGNPHYWRLVPAAGQRLTVGGHYLHDHTTLTAPLSGDIFLVALYDAALSTAEVAANLARGPPSVLPIAAAPANNSATGLLEAASGDTTYFVLPVADADQSRGLDLGLSARLVSVSPPGVGVFRDASCAAAGPANCTDTLDVGEIAGDAGLGGPAVAFQPTKGWTGVVTVEFVGVDGRFFESATSVSFNITVVRPPSIPPTSAGGERVVVFLQSVDISVTVNDADRAWGWDTTVGILIESLLLGELTVTATDAPVLVGDVVYPDAGDTLGLTYHAPLAMEVAGGAIMELRFRAVDEAGTSSVVYAYVFNITAAPPIPVVDAFTHETHESFSSFIRLRSSTDAPASSFVITAMDDDLGGDLFLVDNANFTVGTALGPADLPVTVPSSGGFLRFAADPLDPVDRQLLASSLTYTATHPVPEWVNSANLTLAIRNRVAISEAPLAVVEDTTLNFTLQASDVTGGIVIVWLTMLPTHGTFYQNGNEITSLASSLTTPPSLSYVPEADFDGVDVFGYRVQATSKTISRNISLVFQPVADAPRIGAVSGAVASDFEVFDHDLTELTFVRVHDVDSAYLNARVTAFGPGTLATSANAALNRSLAFNGTADAVAGALASLWFRVPAEFDVVNETVSELVVTVSDDGGLTSERSFVVSILPGERPPATVVDSVSARNIGMAIGGASIVGLILCGLGVLLFLKCCRKSRNKVYVAESKADGTVTMTKTKNVSKLVRAALEDPSAYVGGGWAWEIFSMDFDGRRVAVKHLTPRGQASKEETFLFHNEATILSSLLQRTHPHVIALRFVCDDPAAIGTEFIEGGALDGLLQTKSFTLPEKLRFAEHICAGMLFLHGAGIVHNDLRPHNCVVVASTGVLKVTHFSCAEIVGYEGTRGKLSRASKARDGVKDVDVWQSTKTFDRGYGDFKYFAPERYHATKEGGTGYVDDPRPCDVFSFGIALWAITSGLVPYPREDAETLAQRVALNPAFRPDVDAAPVPVRDVIESCWSPRAPDRPRFSELRDTIRRIRRMNHNNSGSNSTDDDQTTIESDGNDPLAGDLVRDASPAATGNGQTARGTFDGLEPARNDSRGRRTGGRSGGRSGRSTLPGAVASASSDGGRRRGR